MLRGMSDVYLPHDHFQKEPHESIAANPRAAVIYEVNLQIEETVYEAYLAWLKPHVNTIVALPGFRSADLYTEHSAPVAGKKKVTVLYTVDSMTALQSYLETQAAALREEGLKRFPGQFSATRQCLQFEQRIASQ